jgi:hypothetical protein
MMSDLAEKGIYPTKQEKSMIFNPVGLDIGAETAEEIALSIIAEIKAVYSGKMGKSLRVSGRDHSFPRRHKNTGEENSVNDEKQHIINPAIIILASGNSSRLGHPKQLLKFKNQTLLRHAAHAALATGIRPVLVVLGADRETFKEELIGTEAKIIVNNEWNEGMASSIRYGIKELQDNFPSTDGAIIMVCDQPLVHKGLLSQLLETQRKKRQTCGGFLL